jgi:hypothetical protein
MQQKRDNFLSLSGCLDCVRGKRINYEFIGILVQILSYFA